MKAGHPAASSSGSGAAIADFQVPLALGTQTGGSMIRPASFNGIYAIKSTWGSVSREGQKIYSLNLDTLGWYARSIEDLTLLATIFGLKADETTKSPVPSTASATSNSPSAKPWSGTTPAQAPAPPSQSSGASITDLSLPPEFHQLPHLHTTILFSDGRVSFLPEYRLAKSSLSTDLVSHVEEFHGYTRKQYLDACDTLALLRPKFDTLAEEFDTLAEEFDAVIVPSVPDIAPEGLERTGSAVFQSFWTALHVPIVNLPGFTGEEDMPIGLSLVAPRYRDLHLLSVAEEVAKVWVREPLELPEERRRGRKREAIA
ncbi:hypothetical protein CBER1_09550 [Cercospora berteroae]|uniref:Amidase domain-containing protein n=1 Tax=Cercospora berteroae TaxID=357750 RepID=A0A2S6BXW5_9PEZI|nr:hypothetical protein CBER1_09550 [Cercospora berteroae]